MERYAASEMANIEVKDAPTTAFEMAWSIAQVVKTLVGRPIHVAIVKGLNRKLNYTISNQPRTPGHIQTHAAAIAKLLHFLSFLGEV